MISTFAQQNSDMQMDKLEEVEKVVKLAPRGNFLEIGTRMGGTAILAMENMPEGSTLISVDPYGAKPFSGWKGEVVTEFTDKYYAQAIKNLAVVALEQNRNFVQYKMTSLDFLNNEAFVWLYGEAVKLDEMKFSYVLLDGEHTNETVQAELDILADRMVDGGVVLVDNIDWLSIDFSTWVKPRFDMAYKIY